MARAADRASVATEPREDVFSYEDETSGLQRQLGPIGLLFACVGSIIGSGWLFGAFNASILSGPAAVLSWVIGAVVIMLIGLVYAEIGVMFPVSGGVARYPHWSFGSFASYTMGWVTWLAAASVAPIEVEGALQYTRHYITWLAAPDGTLTGAGYGIAVAAMAVFVMINFIGIKWFARLNNVVVWWKLGVISAVIIAFFVTSFHSGNYTSHGFAPYGGEGIFSSVSTAGIVFSFLGFRQGIELAGETKNPRRYVPLAVIGGVALTAVIYILLQLAFIGSLDPGYLTHGWAAIKTSNLQTSPLAVLAGVIGLAWLGSILYADAIISPADTGLIYTTVTARISYAMGRNENAPRELAATTRRGAPWVSLTLAWAVGLIFFLPFPSWQKLVGFVTSATVLSFGSGPLVLAAMRRQLPDEPRAFRLPGGHVLPFLAFWAANMAIYWAGWTTNWKLFIGVGIGFVLLALYYLWEQVFRGRPLPPMDWRAGAWVLPWFGLLIITSYLSPYGGGVSAWGAFEGFGVMFGVSTVIYVLAYYVKLPAAVTRRYIEHASDTRLAPESSAGPGAAGQPAT